jgi:serine phosphatase RsbU (regulator of sigma subunit)
MSVSADSLPGVGAIALVVDDDRVTRAVVCESLRQFGCATVLEAGDGIEAQEILTARPEIDLVIVDIVMPRLDGLGLVAWAREHCPGPVYVILSALDRFDKAVEAIRLGAFDFLAKPVRTEELEVSVRNALEHHALLLERARLQSDLLRKVEELEQKSQLAHRDLQRAEVIQRALLPQAPPSLEEHTVRALYRPGRYVGGDLYDIKRVGDDLAFYIADATGHGVTAAMLSVLFKERLRQFEESGIARPPAAVLHDANLALVVDVNAPGLFLTAACGVLNLRTGDLRLASAGHPPMLHQPSGGKARLIRRTGPALGLSAEARFYEERCQLAAGDRLLLYTDGLSGTDDAAATARLCAVLESGAAGPIEIIEAVQAGHTNGIAADEIDDVTLLLLDAAPGSSWCDNGALGDRGALRLPVDTRQPVVFHGESDEAWFLTLRGRATWLHSDAFYEAGCSMLEEHHALVIDLADCDYLDSTALGTVHELVGLGRVQVQGVQPTVRSLFEELSMRKVLGHISDSPMPRPELYPLTAPSAAASGSLRVLRAHEALASLDSSNRDRFQTVLEAMRGSPGRS